MFLMLSVFCAVPVSLLLKYIKLYKKRNGTGEITTDTTEVQKVVREHNQQLYDNKLNNLEEMDKFLETYSLPKLIQEETDNLNRPITRSKVEYVI